MLSCFDIRKESNLEEVRQALAAYMTHMQELDLVVGADPIGIRQSDTILDTDEERSQAYLLLMHFRDRAQSDDAVRHIESFQEPAASIHRELYSKLESLVFICWEDS